MVLIPRSPEVFLLIQSCFFPRHRRSSNSPPSVKTALFFYSPRLPRNQAGVADIGNQPHVPFSHRTILRHLLNERKTPRVLKGLSLFFPLPSLNNAMMNNSCVGSLWFPTSPSKRPSPRPLEGKKDRLSKSRPRFFHFPRSPL